MVPGHSGISGNKAADSLATRGADNLSKNSQSDATSRNNGISTELPAGTYQDLLQATATRKYRRDVSNTPVPGCINGSNGSQQTGKKSTNAEVPKFKNVIILTIHRL